MLIQLLPEQIARHWDYIKYGVRESLPPTSRPFASLDPLLDQLLAGQAQCWVGFRQEEGKTIIEGYLVTVPLDDAITKTRNLLIYSIYSSSFITQDAWRDGLETLSKWARSEGLHAILAYSNVPRVLEMVERLGGDTSTRLITIPLEV